MKKFWKILAAAAAVSMVPVVIVKDPETGEQSINALLWQVRTRRDPITGKQEVTAVSIIPNRRCKGRELPFRLSKSE